MTLDTLFLLVVPVYLVLIAYGQVGSRRRRVGGRARLIAGGLRVALPPLALVAALSSIGDTMLLRAWGPVVLAMAIAGAIVALLVERVAPRLGA